jgi:hypothetical protein
MNEFDHLSRNSLLEIALLGAEVGFNGMAVGNQCAVLPLPHLANHVFHQQLECWAKECWAKAVSGCSMCITPHPCMCRAHGERMIT